MARFRRARAWYGRRRAGRLGRAWRGRAYSRGGFQAKLSLPWGLSVAAGYLAPEVVPYQTTAITALAVMPVSFGSYRWKTMAQGYVLGRLIKQFVPNPLGGSGGNGGDFA